MAPLAIARTREFKWGSINVASVAGAIATVSLTLPNNVGGTVTTNFAGGNPYYIGFAQEFALLDLPASFVNYVKQFEQYKIDRVGIRTPASVLCVAKTLVHADRAQVQASLGLHHQQ